MIFITIRRKTNVAVNLAKLKKQMFLILSWKQTTYILHQKYLNLKNNQLSLIYHILENYCSFVEVLMN